MEGIIITSELDFGCLADKARLTFVHFLVADDRLEEPDVLILRQRLMKQLGCCGHDRAPSPMRRDDAGVRSAL